MFSDSFDPRVTNEFASAAFRFGHSLIPSNFLSMSKRTRFRTQGVTKKMKLREIFFKPQEMSSSPDMTDNLIRGMTNQDGEAWDNVFSEDVVNHLFETKPNSGGMDLVALNIQRGRDHGIPGYNTYREAVGVGRARNFDDLRDSISPEYVQKLKKLYDDVDDIDLFVGGFLEKKHKDSLIGPAFKSIIGDTFIRLKYGDRFFYDLGKDKNTRFTPRQLQEIRKTSMSRVFCDNSEIDEIQPQAFLKEGEFPNIKTQCDDVSAIPRVNLGVF